jgi:CheY-like chemotaxis protein
MANRKILYGDDNEQNRQRVAESLRERGYNVDLVDSHQEFISRARAGDYRALVTDLDFSPEGAEGYEVMRQIRKVPSLKILFTGRVGFENAVEGLERGADWVVLHKNLGELVKVLEKELKGGNK